MMELYVKIRTFLKLKMLLNRLSLRLIFAQPLHIFFPKFFTLMMLKEFNIVRNGGSLKSLRKHWVLSNWTWITWFRFFTQFCLTIVLFWLFSFDFQVVLTNSFFPDFFFILTLFFGMQSMCTLHGISSLSSFDMNDW